MLYFVSTKMINFTKPFKRQSSRFFVLNLVSAIQGHIISDLVLKTCTQLWHRPFDLTCIFSSMIEPAGGPEHGQIGWPKLSSHYVLAASKIHQHMHLFFTMPNWILPARFWPGQTANEAPSQPVLQASAPNVSSNSNFEKMLLIVFFNPFFSFFHIFNSKCTLLLFISNTSYIYRNIYLYLASDRSLIKFHFEKKKSSDHICIYLLLTAIKCTIQISLLWL